MKGLLLKDWYLITRYCRAFFLMDAVFIGVSLWAPESVIFLAYPCLFSAMIPVTLYSYDEREKWSAYSAALPVSRAQYVSTKYIIGLLAVAAIFLVNVLLREAVAVFAPELAADYLPVLISASALGLLLPVVSLPLMLRFGAEKGRIVYFVFIGVICAACFIVLDRDGAPSVIDAAPAAPVLLCVLALALYAASWLLSVRLYSRRDL